MRRFRRFEAVVLLCCAGAVAGCSHKNPQQGASAPAEDVRKDAGPSAQMHDAAVSHAPKHGGAADGGSTGDAATTESTATDAGPAATSPADAGGDGGSRDCPTKCPAPSVCGHIGGGVFCLCPKGYHYVDVGGDQPPCAADCNDCDGG